MLAAPYHRNLYEILVLTLILIHRSHNTHKSTMASAALPSPAGTKMMRRNYTMAQVASLQACMEDSNLNRLIHQLLMQIIRWIGGWLLVGLGVRDI